MKVQYFECIGFPTPQMGWFLEDAPVNKNVGNEPDFDPENKHEKTPECRLLFLADFCYACNCGWPETSGPMAA